MCKYQNKEKGYEIGAYGATFNLRSIFVYKTMTLCEGYFIRKEHWLKILDDHLTISKGLKKKVKL